MKEYEKLQATTAASRRTLPPAYAAPFFQCAIHSDTPIVNDAL